MEKRRLLRQFGAELRLVRPCSIVHDDHYCNVAARLAAETEGAIFADQFETESNVRAHELTTAEEVWEQMGGRLDAFVMGAGTGGLIAGVSRVLKRRLPRARVVLADPNGSVLYNKVHARAHTHAHTHTHTCTPAGEARCGVRAAAGGAEAAQAPVRHDHGGHRPGSHHCQLCSGAGGRCGEGG